MKIGGRRTPLETGTPAPASVQLMSAGAGLRPRRLLELENFEEVVCAGVDDDEVLVAVDGDALGRVDFGRDAVVEGAVDGTRGVQVAGAVQQQAAVALVTDDQVG